MYSVSEALQEALNSGNPQRVLLVFGETEFTNEDISITNGLTLSEEFNSEEDITIGTCPSSTISFTLLNDDRQLIDFEFGWFNAYIGARIDSGTPTEITRSYLENGEWETYAFCPLGVFYASKPKYLNRDLISVSAYDRMLLFEKDMPSAATISLSYPTTIGGILESIGNYCDINVPEEFLNDDLEVDTEPSEFDNASIRDVVAWIAECACSIARFGRDGDLEFVWFTSTGKTYDENDYSKFESAWYSTHPINGVYFRDTEGCTEVSLGTSKTNNYLIMDNPFLKGE